MKKEDSSAGYMDAAQGVTGGRQASVLLPCLQHRHRPCLPPLTDPGHLRTSGAQAKFLGQMGPRRGNGGPRDTCRIPKSSMGSRPARRGCTIRLQLTSIQAKQKLDWQFYIQYRRKINYYLKNKLSYNSEPARANNVLGGKRVTIH